MRKTPFAWLLAAALAAGNASLAGAQDQLQDVGAVMPKAADGFTIELVAGPPLVDRPIVASFDDDGRLYVAESSGSNDPVEVQLDERPHRILRLEDSNGDGRFDRRTVFADKMMFPEGAQFLDGSLYVSAPPSIWKLTDRDGDGVADERVEWFQGKTLTGCANDLHGPYLGPDGWLYWCKGAFAEQTHEVRGVEWTTRAAHIFRRHPAGGELEPVMTGGMDNPVDVVFTPDGERIFSATYLNGEPRHDGISHAVYGGVFGKPHGVLDGHPRTGEFMPALTDWSAAAPCGLERYESPAFGSEYRDNLFVCQFNLRKVSRHILKPSGSSYVSEESDFVTCDHVDFHPTDVLADADGSLLVIDTGGWYKLCCPTSQLWKPDVLGAIYRVRRIGAPAIEDPRGRLIAWDSLAPEDLWSLLSDARPAVRQRATRTLASRRDSDAVRAFVNRLNKRGIADALSLPASQESAAPCDARTSSLARVWALSQIEGADAQSLVLQALGHVDESVRHAAMNVVSLNRDDKAAARLTEILANDTAANRRIAAEALGRLGVRAAVPHLLAAAARASEDRHLQHSIRYALIELADPEATQAGLSSDSTETLGAALVALDQMPGGSIEPAHVIPLLNSADDSLRQTARWLVGRHPEWGGDLAGWFRNQLATLPDRPQLEGVIADETSVEPLLVAFASHPVIQELLAESACDAKFPIAARLASLRVMSQVRLDEPPQAWGGVLATVIGDADPATLPGAVDAARAMTATDTPTDSRDDVLNRALAATAETSALPRELRLAALAAASPGIELSDAQFQLLVSGLSVENSIKARSDAADALSRAGLTLAQRGELCQALATAGPLEINRLLAAFAQTDDDRLAQSLLDSLKDASALASVQFALLRESLAKCSPAVLHAIDALESLVNVDAAAQRGRIEELLPLMADGDVRRGHAVFYSSKAACTACHQLGLGGGVSGPDLSRIGEIRTERDLLESILYPSLSFVRSYEPMQILTVGGKSINGTIRNETADEFLLATGPNQEERIPRADVEEIQPSTVSIMPAGLDKVLSPQELADLVAFLKRGPEN